MAQPVIKTSFASGEWAPKLRSRVDIQKYHAGASQMRNFYVDYSGGGASTRQGTKFLAKVGNTSFPVRLIAFQPSATVTYVLEFGHFYIRFYTNGAQIVSGGSPYQISSPFNANDLFPNPNTGNPGIKFVQDVTSMIITHPSYPAQILTINNATSWQISTINFGPTIGTPTNLALSSTDGAGVVWFYAYLVTAVDINGQESAVPTPATFAGTHYIGDSTNPLSNTLSWTGVNGAQSYNVYKATPSYKSAVPAGAQYGFIGNVVGTSFIDSFPGIAPDFSQTPPVSQNPFLGTGVLSYTVGVTGVYTVVPSVTVAAPPSGVQATAEASLGMTSVAIANHNAGSLDIVIISGSPDPVGSFISFNNGAVAQITADTFISSAGGNDRYLITSVALQSPGSVTGAGTTTPANPVAPVGSSATGFVIFGAGFNFTLTWGVTQVLPLMPGTGYFTAPAVTFSGGAASATAVLQAVVGGNPGVPGFIQERLALADQQNAPQTLNLSQPGSFFNFNVSNPIQPDDAISASIVSSELNDIKSLTAVPAGLLSLTGKSAWIFNGGGGISTLTPITPSTITATPQAFNGANHLPPIKINMEILYGTNKGNYVRDLTYNIYANIFSGSDISVLSNHLFFGHYLLDWAWAEEPLKTLWVTREDGVLLSLGYVKEQDLIGWAHHDTNGRFLSVCSVLEIVNGNSVDAVYVVTQRILNGAVVQSVERMADRYFTFGYEDSWNVDCALQTAAQVTQPGILTISGNVNVVGTSVIVADDTSPASPPFTAGMVGWAIRANGGIYNITAFTSSIQVTATVVRVPNDAQSYNTTFYEPVVGGYTVWQPITTVTGLTQLAGLTVTGVADGAVVPPTVVSGGGSITLSTAASKITLGLAYTPQLQTLPIDTGMPTIQSKRKKLPAATLRVADTLGLQIGTTFANAVTMKDFQIGAIPTTSNGVTSVTDLYSGDGRTILNQVWQEFGVMAIQQNLPYPATILGVFPELEVGDTPK